MTRTRVVNIRRERCDVYIGRARRGEPPTKWGNPAIVGRPPPAWLLEYIAHRPEAAYFSTDRDLTRHDAIALYRALIETRVERGELTREDFEPLRGQALGCFCKPQPCHGDVIAEITDEITADGRTTGR